MKRISLLMMMSVLAVVRLMAFNGYELASEGAWCWFADPRALHYENETGTINATYIGYIDVHGNIKATQMDFLSGRRSDVLVRSYFQPDDHDNPTFLVLPDERIMLIYSRHTDEKAFYYRVSVNPGDITMLGEEKEITTANNTTYPSPFILSDDPTHFYLCWRGINWHPTIAKFTVPDENDDVTCEWGPYQMVQSTGSRPYAKYASNGKNEIYFTYTTGHPDNEQPNWIYFNVIDINAESGSPVLKDIMGNQLSVIEDGAFNVSKTTTYKNNYPYTLVDAPSSLRDWVWQVAPDSAGNPIIAMVRISTDKSQHEYCYAYWTGSEWGVTDLADGGGRFHSSSTEYCYSGGLSLDPADTHIIYLSIPTEGDEDEVYEIWKYTLGSDYAVEQTEQITTASEKNNVRPYIIPGSEDSPLRLGWMNGDYYYWMVNTSYPLGFPTAIYTDYDWPENDTLPDDLTTTDYGTKEMTDSDADTVGIESTTGNFTINVSMEVSEDAYYGTFVACDAFTIGLDESTVLPYVIINGTQYDSTNKFYTSDDWADNSSGTNSDNWPTYLGQFNMTVVKEDSRLTIYRNGYADIVVEDDALSCPDSVTIGGFTGILYSAATTEQALTSLQVRALMQQQTLDMIYLPDVTYTDVVLPTSLNEQTVSWTSDNPDVIASDGTFTAPETQTTVTLTATVGSTQKAFFIEAMPRDIENNLIAYYDFEEDNVYIKDDTTFVTDLSGCSGDIKLMGTATADGTLNLTANSPIDFDNNGYAIAPAAIMDSLRSFTFAFTATPASLSTAPRFYDFGYNSSNSLFFRANALAAGIKYQGGTTTMVSASTSLTVDTEYKLAVTFDAGSQTTTIYIDGEAVASGTSNTNEAYMIAADGTCTRNYIGRTQWWQSSVADDNADYVGTIDNLRIYNTALTQTELAEIQNIRLEDDALNVDCTQERIENYDFEGSYDEADGTGVSSDRAIYLPEGWELVYSSGNENDMSILNYSCTASENFSDDLIDSETNGSNAYLIRQKWGTSTIGLSQQIDTLPAGIYRLEVQEYQSGSGGSATLSAQSGEQDAVENTSSNAATWNTTNVKFMTSGTDNVTISASATHTSNGTEKFTGFDNFSLLNITANQNEEDLCTLLALMSDAADELLDTSLSTSVEATLTAANDAAKSASTTDEQSTLVEIYETLRDAIWLALQPNDADAITIVESDDETDAVNAKAKNIYNLGGQLVKSGATDNLKKGIYIQDGKKITVSK